MPRKRKLTTSQWHDVFRIRCRSKSGASLEAYELNLCKQAMGEDPKRYAEMDLEVFNATLPFGAAPRRRM